MSYVAGIDGGGTKTLAIIARTSGEILGVGTAGPSNVSTLGIVKARTAVERAFLNALRSCRIPRREISAICLG
ncbi:MAG: N-acetylglucosamine kinase, partial [Thermoplasmata archaeon]